MYNPILIVEEFSRPVTQQGEILDLGIFHVDYDGTGAWYISGAKDSLEKIVCDNRLIIDGGNGLITGKRFYNGGDGFEPENPINITDLLLNGRNNVNIKIADQDGLNIGSTDLYFFYSEKVISENDVTDITQAISHYNITNKLNDPCTTFAVKFSIDFDPEEFVTGPHIHFQLTDTLNTDDFMVYNGKIQSVARNIIIGNKTYDITGRDNGYYLSRQNYGLNSTFASVTNYKFFDIIRDILKNTNINIGIGNPALENILLVNNPEATNFFGGEFKPKWKAIEYLFQVYSKVKGLKKIRWFIDSSSSLRWFEVKTDFGNIVPIIESDDLVSVDISEDASNIVNYLEGYITVDNKKETIVVEDKESQKIYGRLEGDPTSCSEGTNNEFTEDLKEQLDVKAWPIYSGNVVFAGIKDYICGMKIKFIDDQKYANIPFTIVGVTKEGSPANPQTKLDITTDENAITPSNLFENIQTIVEQTVNTAAPATVVEVSENTGNNGKKIIVNRDNSKYNTPAVYIFRAGGSGGNGGEA